MKKTLSLTLLTSTLLSVNTLAVTKSIKVNLNSQHTKGVSRVPLARLLTQNGAKLNQGWDLKKLTLKAKSKNGNAQAVLKMGRASSYPTLIPGTPQNFKSNSEGFKSVKLEVGQTYRGQNSVQRASILLDGNIKIANINVTLDKELKYDYTNDYGLRYKKLAEFKASKVVGSQKTLNVQGNLDSIKLTATKGKVKVSQVTIVYRNGDKITLNELHGNLKSSHAPKVFTLKNTMKRPVRKILIDAQTTSLFGSRGKIKVDVAK